MGYEDDSNRSKISKLLRFHSTKSEDKMINLDKYLDRMQESQESIYYMSGDSLDTMKKAPALQMFLKKDLEVLMLSDHLDEPCIQKLADYEGKKFVSVQKADVKLDESEEEIKRAQAFQNKDQIQMMAGRKTLEINGNHAVVYDLLQKVKDNKEDVNAKD